MIATNFISGERNEKRGTLTVWHNVGTEEEKNEIAQVPRQVLGYLAFFLYVFAV